MTESHLRYPGPRMAPEQCDHGVQLYRPPFIGHNPLGPLEQGQVRIGPPKAGNLRPMKFPPSPPPSKRPSKAGRLWPRHVTECRPRSARSRAR